MRMYAFEGNRSCSESYIGETTRNVTVRTAANTMTHTNFRATSTSQTITQVPQTQFESYLHNTNFVKRKILVVKEFSYNKNIHRSTNKPTVTLKTYSFSLIIPPPPSSSSPPPLLLLLLFFFFFFFLLFLLLVLRFP